jgi:hypothetical protein
VKGFEHGANSQKLKVEGSRLRVEIERIKCTDISLERLKEDRSTTRMSIDAKSDRKDSWLALVAEASLSWLHCSLVGA